MSLGRDRVRSWPRSTWCSPCCTAPTARTAPSRGCSNWPGCRTSARGAGERRRDGQGVHQEAAGRRRAADRRPGGAAAASATVELEDRERLGLPVFVKPARGGSSIGVTRVSAWDQLPAAIADARRHDPKVIVEAAVPGRELECGVLEFPDGRSKPAPSARSGWPACEGARTRSTTSPPNTSTTPPSSTCPPRSTTTSATRCANWPSGRFTPSTARAWPGWTSSSPRTGPSSTRSTRCPGSPRSRCTRGCGRPAGVDYPTLLAAMVDTALARGTGLR